VGQLANLSVADHVRAGRLVPLLLSHMSSHIGVHVYFGSRAAQPKRVRAFIDLALARLVDCPRYVLSAKELGAAALAAKRKRRA
jgi:DNA-binding transcriptional LysR family regulator